MADTADRRIPGRTRVLMTAVLYTSQGAQSVRVQDLSRRGARILADRPIANEGDALFKRADVFAAARITWLANDTAGLIFYRELSEAELDSAFNSVASGSCRTKRPTNHHAPRSILKSERKETTVL